MQEITPYSWIRDSNRSHVIEMSESQIREQIQDTITDFEQIKDKTSAHYKLRPNEPMYRQDFSHSSDDADERPLNSDVALTIKMSPYQDVSSLQIGDSIDVSASYADSIGSRFFWIENLEVLAVRVDDVPNQLQLRMKQTEALALKFCAGDEDNDFRFAIRKKSKAARPTP